MWHGRSILDVVRGYPDKKRVPAAVRSNCELDRREVISVTPFKRTLGQYKEFIEVAKAIADGYRG